MIDLKFHQVSKKYNIRANGDSPKRWYGRGFLGRKKPGQMWALRNVSFQVNEGEALGIVGHNGAGKTTILKILSGITTPTAGEITIRGRLVALVEVSSGFHPELTGIENVYLHGAMLGMRRSEIRQKLDSIIEFSGVGRYIECPSNDTHRACLSAWALPLPPTSIPTSFCWTKSSPSATQLFRPNASKGSQNCEKTAAPWSSFLMISPPFTACAIGHCC